MCRRRTESGAIRVVRRERHGRNRYGYIRCFLKAIAGTGISNFTAKQCDLTAWDTITAGEKAMRRATHTTHHRYYPMHRAKNNIGFWLALMRNLSLLSPFHHFCLAHSRKHVAWHNFWSLTWTHSKGKGCRCWLDVSFTLGDKLLCEQAILDFQGHRMHLRDCQRSAFVLLFTLKTTNRRMIL